MGLSEYASGSWVGGGWVRSMDTYKYVHVDVDTRTNYGYEQSTWHMCGDKMQRIVK